jgi:hypothetical protein
MWGEERCRQRRLECTGGASRPPRGLHGRGTVDGRRFGAFGSNDRYTAQNPAGRRMSVGPKNRRTPAATKKTKRITPKLLLVIEERSRSLLAGEASNSITDSITIPDASHSLSDGGQSRPNRHDNSPTSSKQARTRKSNQNSRQTPPKLGFLDDRHHSLRRIQSWPGHLLIGASPHHRCSFGKALACYFAH